MSNQPPDTIGGKDEVWEIFPIFFRDLTDFFPLFFNQLSHHLPTVPFWPNPKPTLMTMICNLSKFFDGVPSYILIFILPNQQHGKHVV